jgi:signal transduction histidine kinase/ActR/RegA family two-component response regulator
MMKTMKPLSMWSVRAKIFSLVTILLAVICIFIYLYFPAALERETLLAFEHKADVIGLITAYSLAPAILFDDSTTLREILQAAQQDDDIAYLVVVDTHGAIVSAYGEAIALRAGYRAAAENLGVTKDGRYFRTYTPVLHDDRIIGSLYLGLSLHQVADDVRRSRNTIAVVSFLIFLLGVIAVFIISTLIIRPLEAMVGTVEAITEGDLSKRAAIFSNDEIGHLAASFNAMVDRLEQAYNELEAVNRTLEDRITKRTRALEEEIVERKQLEQQLIQAQKMETIGTLAGGIAHDFNNLLGIILGYAHRMRSAPENIDAKALDAIIMATERGAGLVRQLLTFARKTEVQFESVHVEGVLRELTLLLRDTFPKTIDIRLDIEPNLPSIKADPNQLHQALLNLCLNARDAMPNGGALTLRASTAASDTLRLKHPQATQQRYVCLCVTDSGQGMDQPTQDRIFEPFFSTKDRHKGTGLGLAVVYGIVNAHNGFIDVESRVGAGTSIQLYLPAPPTPLPESLEMRTTDDESVRGTETILVVEDEEMLRDLLQGMFESRGYRVLTASDGEEAVRVFAGNKERIALVLSDMGLPKLGGWEAFLEMRTLNPAVKVILASGYFDLNLKAEMVRAGAKDFIQKPYVPQLILRQVRQTLDETA